MQVTTTEMSEILRVSRQTISKYVKEGMPRLTKTHFDPADALHWYIETKVRKVDAHARDALYRTQQEKTAIEVETMRGNLIRADDHYHCVTTIAGLFVSNLEGMAPRLAQVVAPETEPAIIEDLIDGEVRELRGTIAAELESLSSIVRARKADSGDPPEAPRGRVGKRAPKTATRKPRARALAK